MQNMYPAVAVTQNQSRAFAETELSSNLCLFLFFSLCFGGSGNAVCNQVIVENNLTSPLVPKDPDKDFLNLLYNLFLTFSFK